MQVRQIVVAAGGRATAQATNEAATEVTTAARPPAAHRRGATEQAAPQPRKTMPLTNAVPRPRPPPRTDARRHAVAGLCHAAAAAPATPALLGATRRSAEPGRTALAARRRPLPADDWNAAARPRWVRTARAGSDAAGIAPERYVESRRGREQRAVNFQHEAGRITFSGPCFSFPCCRGPRIA